MNPMNVSFYKKSFTKITKTKHMLLIKATFKREHNYPFYKEECAWLLHANNNFTNKKH